MKHVALQDMWCEARRTSGVKHVRLQDEWCAAKPASRTSGVKLVGRWCAKSACRKCGVSCSNRRAGLMLASPSALERDANEGRGMRREAKKGCSRFWIAATVTCCTLPRTRAKTRVVQGCRQGSMAPVIQPTTRFFASHHQPSPRDSPYHRTRHPCPRLPATRTASSGRRQWIILGEVLKSAWFHFPS